MTVKQASEKWSISDRRIRVLCAESKIMGAYQEGRGWGFLIFIRGFKVIYEDIGKIIHNFKASVI